MARVALDADVVIAFLDPADGQHERAVRALRPRLAVGEEILVGASVYAEVMMRPVQRGTHATVDAFLEAIGATVVAVDERGLAGSWHLDRILSPPGGGRPAGCSSAERGAPGRAPRARPVRKRCLYCAS